MSLDQYFEKAHEKEKEEMKIKTLEYHRKFNIGNYQTEEYGLIAELEEGDNYTECARELKQSVYDLQAEGTKIKPPSKDSNSEINKKTSSTILKPEAELEVLLSSIHREFKEYPNWKKGAKKPDGTYEKGSLHYGWEFVETLDGALNFSEDAMKLLGNGDIKIGDEYIVKLSKDGRFVNIQKQR